MSAARSSSVTSRGTTSGAERRWRHETKRGLERLDEQPRVERRALVRSRARVRGGGGGSRLASEDLPATLEPAAQVAPGVAVAAVEDEPLAQRGLWIGALVDA